MNFGIHWFRRDLRIAGNPALEWSRKKHSGRVLGLFCLDPKFLKRDDFSFNRFGFFLETLRSLRQELREAGGDLLVLDDGPEVALKGLFQELEQAGAGLPSALSFNRDYEPFARERDQRISTWLSDRRGIQLHVERDHLLIEPEEILKEDGGFYQIYGAFARKWFSLLRSRRIRERIESQKAGLEYSRCRSEGKKIEPLFHLRWRDLLQVKGRDRLDSYLERNRGKVTIDLPEAGTIAACRRLEDFANQVGEYAETRDYPANEEGTSRFSIFLKNGSLTTAQVIARLGLQDARYKQGTGKAVFLQELVWREFYYSILYHCPRVENEAFLLKFRDLRWENREDFFEAWKEGRTGFPIVDAGMRQLKSTGWMHNRVRMIVASFLTKDLLIDWRWGERYFMNQLLDGDLAANNGGWQWAASTGTDPQPYFRIFNPELQGRRFDPEGEYIRRYVPELRDVPAKKIHAPPGSLARQLGYPAPIIQHASRKMRALRLYQKQLAVKVPQ